MDEEINDNAGFDVPDNVVVLDPFVVNGNDRTTETTTGDELSAEEFDAIFADFLAGGTELPLLDLAPYGFTYDPSGIVIPTNPATVTPSTWEALKNVFKKAASTAVKAATSGGASGGSSGGASSGGSSATQPKPTTTTTTTAKKNFIGLNATHTLILVGIVTGAIVGVAVAVRRK
jgi:hypothetical protein